MLSQAEVESIFRDYLPEDVEVLFVERAAYIRTALQHSFIQKQIEIGIYTDSNIYDDFLSPACSYTLRKEVEVCYDLIVDHAQGVADDLTLAYVTAMASHEAHHFHEEHKPSTADEHALTELACIAATKAKDPALEAKAQEFERMSPVYKKVYLRIAELQKAMMTT